MRSLPGIPRCVLPVVRKILPYVCLLLVLGLYTIVQIRSFTPAYVEVDPDGYLVMAKRIARGEPLASKPKNLFLYQTHVWVENEKGEVTAKFAPGYPALMSVAYKLFDDEGMFYVSPIMGGLALLGMWFLLRQWMDPFPCVLAIATLGLSRMYHFYTGYLLTHGTNLCFVTWGMCFLWKWLRNPSPLWGTAAGLALGFSIAVRHTSAVLGIAILVAIVSRLIQDRKFLADHLHGVLSIVLAYAFFPALVCIYDKVIFGGFLRTGYSFSGEQAAFSVEYFVRNFPVMVKGLNKEMLPLVLQIGLVGMIVLGDARERLVRLAWFVPLFFVYTSYYWAGSSRWHLRFFICTLPLFVGSAYLLLETLKASKFVRRAAMVIVCGLSISMEATELRNALKGELYKNNSRQMAKAARVLSKTLEVDAVVFTRYPFHMYLGTRRSFELYDLSAFKKDHVRQFSELRHDWRRSGPRQQPERKKKLREFYEKTSGKELTEIKRELIRSALAAGRQAAYFIPSSHLGGEGGTLGKDFEFTLLEEWEVPQHHWRRVRNDRWGLYEVKLRQKEDR